MDNTAEKIDIRVKKTYKQLFKAFIELLTEKSFDELTVSEICNKAQVHRATFYKHFEDKYAYLNFVFESSLSEIELIGIQNDSTPQNIKDSFMYFIRIIFEYVKKHKMIFEVVCSEKHSLSLGSSFISAIESYCFSNIQKVLPNNTKESLEIFSAFYANAFIGVVKWYAHSDGNYPLELLYDFFERRVDELCGYYEKNIFN